MPVLVNYGNLTLRICAFLDGGSTITLIDKSLVEKLQLPQRRSNVTIKGISGNTSLLYTNFKVSLNILLDGERITIENALVVPNLTRSLPKQYISREIINLCFNKTGIQINTLNETPSILLGQDNCRLIRVRESRTVVGDNLAVSRCKLGWSVHGNTNNDNIPSSIFLIHEKEQFIPTEKTDDLVKAYFDLDRVGITHTEKSNSDDLYAQYIFDETSRHVEDGWEIGLPWKPGIRSFPDGRSSALRRLYLLEKKLDKDKLYAQKYYKEINRLFEQKFAERVVHSRPPAKLWYVPHFGV